MTEKPTPADRIAKVRRATAPTASEADRARLLLEDLLAVADRHGVTLEDFDWVTDLPGACVDAVRSHDRRNP
ncbi:MULTISPECIES: hypothetical protein [Terrabacteria group]|uniref:hypothetical protein n=1 Tax=Bacillati TaxID=1783272 RepID=UPI00366E3998